MKNLIFEVKKELIEGIKNLDNLETIQALLDLKNFDKTSSVVSYIQS